MSCQFGFMEKYQRNKRRERERQEREQQRSPDKKPDEILFINSPRSAVLDEFAKTDEFMKDIFDQFCVPEPITPIVATPQHTILVGNYNLDSPNKHKYTFDPIGAVMPLIEPLSPIAPIGPLGSLPSSASCSDVSSMAQQHMPGFINFDDEVEVSESEDDCKKKTSIQSKSDGLKQRTKKPLKTRKRLSQTAANFNSARKLESGKRRRASSDEDKAATVAKQKIGPIGPFGSMPSLSSPTSLTTPLPKCSSTDISPNMQKHTFDQIGADMPLIKPIGSIRPLGSLLSFASCGNKLLDKDLEVSESEEDCKKTNSSLPKTKESSKDVQITSKRVALLDELFGSSPIKQHSFSARKFDQIGADMPLIEPIGSIRPLGSLLSFASCGNMLLDKDLEVSESEDDCKKTNSNLPKTKESSKDVQITSKRMALLDELFGSSPIKQHSFSARKLETGKRNRASSDKDEATTFAKKKRITAPRRTLFSSSSSSRDDDKEKTLKIRYGKDEDMVIKEHPQCKTQQSQSTQASDNVTDVIRQRTPIIDDLKGILQPQSQQPIYRSYFERNDKAPSDDFRKLLKEASIRKHAADKDENSINQCSLYLEASIYYMLSGAAMESKSAAVNMFKETLGLIKYTCSKFHHSQHEAQNKVVILSLRCQSLVLLKLYEMQRVSCPNIITQCDNFFKSEIFNGNTPSTISSSGKVVPHDIHSTLQQENQLFSYLSSSHDLWDQADSMVKGGNHTDFFVALDHGNGPLMLHSSMDEVFRYVQAGLKKLKALH